MKLKIAWNPGQYAQQAKTYASRAASGARSFVNAHPAATYIGAPTAVGAIGGGYLGHRWNKIEEKANKRKLHPVEKGVNILRGAMIGGGTGMYAGAGAYVRKHERAYNSYRGYRYGGGAGGGAASSSARQGVPDWLKGVKTKADAKKKWRDIAFQHHPDRGGNAETFKRYSGEWDNFEKHHFDKLSHAMIWAFMNELRGIHEQ